MSTPVVNPNADGNENKLKDHGVLEDLFKMGSTQNEDFTITDEDHETADFEKMGSSVAEKAKLRAQKKKRSGTNKQLLEMDMNILDKTINRLTGDLAAQRAAQQTFEEIDLVNKVTNDALRSFKQQNDESSEAMKAADAYSRSFFAKNPDIDPEHLLSGINVEGGSTGDDIPGNIHAIQKELSSAKDQKEVLGNKSQSVTQQEDDTTRKEQRGASKS